MEILKVENLCKTYGKGNNQVQALNDVSFSVEKGEFVAIVGQSGSGKSTLLHLIGGVDKPTSGHIFVDGQDVYKKNKDSKVYKDICERIGVSPNDCVFVDDSYSNLEFAKEAGMTTVRIYYRNNSAKDKKFIDYAYKGIESFLDDVA